jgi:TP901 family phage tail tape measure protein
MDDSSTTTSGWSTATKTAVAALAAAGAATVKFLKDSVDTGMEFETSVSQIAATMGTTTDKITGLSDAAKEMGATTKFTASEAADGINILAMAGLSESEILEENANGATILATTLSLASAGAMDMASSATYLTGAVKGFGDEASNAQYYADLMAKGATLANTDVTGLGEALSGAAATASAYSQKADSVTVSLLRLAEQNVTGSAASTALAAAMKNLYTPTDAAKTALDNLGVAAYDSSGNARDFNDVVDDLTTALSGYSDEEANAYKNTIFGIQGLDAYNKMASTSTDKVQSFKDGLAGASDEFDGLGAAAGQAATQIDNLQGDVTIFESALSGVQTTVYEKMQPALRTIVQAGTETMTQLGTVLSGGGVDGAVEMINGLADGIAENIPTFLEQALPMVVQFTENLKNNAGTLIDAGLNLIIQLAQGIADSLPVLIENVPQIITNIADIINENAPKVLATGLTIIVTLARGLIQAIPTLISNIPKIIQAIVSVWTAFNWINLGKNIVTAIKNGIKDLPAKAGEIIKSAVEKVKSIFSGGGIGNVVSNIFSGIKNTISNAMAAVKSTVSGILAGIKNAFADKLNAAKTVVSNVIDKIKGLFKFSWSLPKLKLPHVSISGSFSLVPPSVPKFSIEWYKKAYDNAMLLSSPTIFGAANGTLLGGGDGVGSEVVAGANTLMDMIQSSVSGVLDDYSTGSNYGADPLAGVESVLEKRLSSIESRLDAMIAMESQYYPQMASTQIVMDTGALVGATASDMDTQLAKISRKRLRGV